MLDKNNRTTYILLAVAVLAILGGVILLFTWGSSSGKATPTAALDAIYTSAAQTVIAQKATLDASNPSTATPLPTSPVGIPTSTLQLQSLPTSTAAAIISPTSGVAQGCDNSIFVSDITIPDNTIMTPGQTFTKTWQVQNNGTCTWSKSYKLVFDVGEAMSGTSVAVPSEVPPGQQVQLSVNLVAPATAGSFTGNWKLQNDKGQFFGTFLTVVIQVPAPTSTGTSTVTPTASMTPTPKPTDTPSPTPTK
jgi:hypothetical protein